MYVYVYFSSVLSSMCFWEILLHYRSLHLIYKFAKVIYAPAKSDYGHAKNYLHNTFWS